jgi:DNA polymerase I-like protein with 3'-5' exonuclease and polymerase domains
MKSLIFDIEGDGLLHKLTTIWCIVAQDLDTKEIYSFGPNSILEGIEFLKNADRLIGHNILGYDLPAIDQLYGTNMTRESTCIDTLVLSRLFHPTREGGHSLNSWGFRLGFHKIDFDDYSGYSEEMLKYCIRDVEVNTRVFEHLKQYESKGFSKTAIDIEQHTHRIIGQQMMNGFRLDIPYATQFLAKLNEELNAAELKVHETFKPLVHTQVFQRVLVKSGAISKMGYDQTNNKKVKLSLEELLEIKRNPTVERVTSTPFNLSSTQQIGEYLMGFGWKPKQFTDKGRPKVDETVLLSIRGIPEARLIAHYINVKRRQSFVTGWLENVKSDGRVYGYVNTLGTITHRMSHSKPNLGQVPNSSSLYGPECRKCWIVNEGNVLVGIDASGLELRMLAHYLNNDRYTNEILSGDIHSYNQSLAGLESRDQAKTFIYAFLYGAGNAKLGSVVGGNGKDGGRLKLQFLDALPELKDLQERIKKSGGTGKIRGVDGRLVRVRHLHAALNTLLQSAGAIIMKQALVIFEQMVYDKKLRADLVGNIHDEWQVECHPDDAVETGELACEAMRLAGEVLELNCPLAGEYKIGNNWSETH